MIQQQAMYLIQHSHQELYLYLQSPEHEQAFLSDFKNYLSNEIAQIFNEIDRLDTQKTSTQLLESNLPANILIAIKNLFSDIVVHVNAFNFDYVSATHMLTTPPQFIDIMGEVWDVHLAKSQFRLT